MFEITAMKVKVNNGQCFDGPLAGNPECQNITNLARVDRAHVASNEGTTTLEVSSFGTTK